MKTYKELVSEANAPKAPSAELVSKIGQQKEQINALVKSIQKAASKLPTIKQGAHWGHAGDNSRLIELLKEVDDLINKKG